MSCFKSAVVHGYSELYIYIKIKKKNSKEEVALKIDQSVLLWRTMIAEI